MKIFFQYWYLWGLLLLVIGFLAAKNWGKMFGGKDVPKSLKLLRNCRKICNDNYAAAVNQCNQHPNCINVAGIEYDICLGKCK